MKAPSAVGVDRLLAVGRIGREQDVGLIEGLALGDDVAAVEPLQHDAREHEMRGRRADVDADAEHEISSSSTSERPVLRKEYAAACGFFGHSINAPSLSVIRGARAKPRKPASITTHVWICGHRAFTGSPLTRAPAE